MPINVNDPEYVNAEKDYYKASTLEERLIALKKMISHMPKHKGAENLRQQLTTRRKKLEKEIVKAKKSGKSSFKGIKKDDMQAVILGKTNTGKSSLLNILTNAKPKISEFKFTTTQPVIGMMSHATTSIQLIENPAVDSEIYNKGLTNTADTLHLLIDSLDQIKEIEPLLTKATKKRIILFNKIDKLSENKKRKIKATLKSKFKKYPFILISTKTKENIEKLKEKIFTSFGKIRVYTKQPHKKQKEPKPIIMSPKAEVRDAAEKILKGFSKQIKQTRIWGPSSKFPGQKVGLKHKLKDMDVVEFHTR